ncbi:hypothetical protein, partial [Pseudomonas syringae group genomosp. 3]|uniref:hypothetical protein n=1 Tax=Pseudomonas syringae group genomosp. 3 TaxID=251701 RepID=UPI00191658CA
MTFIGEPRRNFVGAQLTSAGTEIHLKAGEKIVIEAGVELTVKMGGICIKPPLPAVDKDKAGGVEDLALVNGKRSTNHTYHQMRLPFILAFPVSSSTAATPHSRPPTAQVATS